MAPQELVDLPRIEGNRGGVAMAVDDGGDLPLAAQGRQHRLPARLAGRGGEFGSFLCHCGLSRNPIVIGPYALDESGAETRGILQVDEGQDLAGCVHVAQRNGYQPGGHAGFAELHRVGIGPRRARGTPRVSNRLLV